jgi:cytochrome c oxidase subunit II
VSRTLVLAVVVGSWSAALLAPTVVWADALTPEAGGSPNADEIDALYKLVLYVALAVFVGVEGMLVYSLFRYRAARGRVAAQIRGNTRLEMGWTVGGALILVVLTVITFIKLGAISQPSAAAPAVATVGDTPADSRALRIEVSGQQYIWRFRYPSGVLAYEQMVVPTGTTVLLDIVSKDVAHSWWIPRLGGKADAIPGYTNHTWFRITRAGVFRGQCAELCGRNHADMTAHVRAVSPNDFRAWLKAQQRDLDEARSDLGATRGAP